MKVKARVHKPNTNRTYEGFKLWSAFYRALPHVFAKQYLGLNLFLYQKILLYAMNHYNFFMYIAARGQGKSYIIAIYCIIRAILYPNTNIVLASGTKGQARLIISEKILSIRNNSANLQREIAEVKTGVNECYVLFTNGSKITAVTSGEGARGYRANILIVDEFRLLKKETVEQILRPFLNVNRTPPYLQNPKYSHLSEENKEIYISSAWYKNHWIWESFKSYLNKMLSGKDSFVAVLPYQLSVYHRLLSKKRVEQTLTADDFDKMSFDMEYEALFVGENENAYFKLDDIQKCRTLPKAYNPPTDLEYVENRDKRKKPSMPKQLGELRLVGLDIALMGSNKNIKNDTTAFTLMRLLPEGDSYRRDVVYLESIAGQHSELQAIRLKQLFYDFEADFVAMDTNGVGLSIYDSCTKILYDKARDIEYPAWTVVEGDEMMDSRKLEENAIPVIYSIKANPEINHKVATGLRSALEKQKIKLLINDIEAREELIEEKGLLSKTEEEQVRLMKPFTQTTALMNELINLIYEVRSGFIKIKEVGTTTKDRYSSIAYCNYVANILEEELQKGKHGSDELLGFCLF